MSKTGLTQLVGRILRQPYAHKTGISCLDESYVYCFSRSGNEILKDIKKGFHLDGLQGLEPMSTSSADDLTKRQQQKIKPRTRYQTAVRDLLLPAFMIQDGSQWRLVHYNTDILSQLPWEEIDISPIGELKLEEKSHGNDDFVVNLSTEYHIEQSQNST